MKNVLSEANACQGLAYAHWDHRLAYLGGKACGDSKGGLKGV